MPSIQGFATDISVDQGQTVDFKIDTDSTDYRIDIYRLGYYGGLGARKVATIQPTATHHGDRSAGLPVIDGTDQRQPGRLRQLERVGLVGGAADRSSGIYLARPTRQDVGGDLASHIAVHRARRRRRLRPPGPDLRHDLAGLQPVRRLQPLRRATRGHAHKVSYNRPFTTRDTPTEDWLFNAEYPMLRWLERNGYDVSYFTDVDSDRQGAEILEHNVFMSSGHDEYWSAGQRANVEAARDAGVDLAFFSGNEMLLEDALGASADGVEHAVPDAGRLQGGLRAGQREHWDCFNDFACDPDPTRGPGSGGRTTPATTAGGPKTPLRPDQLGQRTTADPGPGGRSRGLASGGTRRSSSGDGTTTLDGSTLGYEFDGEQPGIRAYATRLAGSPCRHERRGRNHQMSLYAAAERCARLRRGHRPMVVGPGRDP